MTDQIFSSARLRAYRVLAEEGLGSAESFQILNTIASARLWIPLSLIEIAFRNAVDAVVTAAHPAGEAWLCDAEGDEIDWARIVGRPIFQQRTNDGTAPLADQPVEGGLSESATDEEAAPATDDDDLPPDPVAVAARMAARHGRPVVTRDDVISHLMLGFWTFRGPAGLRNEGPPIEVYELLTTKQFGGKFDSAKKLEDLMIGDILMIRNRVAHHEPVLIRALYVFVKKTGAARTGNDLVTSLQGAVGKFERLVETVIKTAKAMVPMASAELDTLAEEIASDIEPFKERLEAKFAENKRANDARKAQRKAAWELAQQRAGSSD